MEAQTCPKSNFPSQNRSACLGTRGDWSVRSAHCCQSRFGPFARASNWQATSRSGAVQPRDRQQAARVRSRSTQSRRPRDRRSRPRTCLVVQSKTGRPVQFEVSENTRNSVLEWVNTPEMHGCVLLFPSRFHASPHLSTRQYARLVHDWVSAIGLDPSGYGTHSLRRTKAALIYRKTGNLRAVQLLLGHTKVDSTVRYLGVELEDALSISERIDI